MNGQAKTDFEKWFIEFEDILSNNKELNIIGNALIIEWFDSVGIYIETGGADYRGVEFWYNIQEKNTINGHNGEYFNSRQQAAEKALEKAIILYNEKFKENEN